MKTPCSMLESKAIGEVMLLSWILAGGAQLENPGNVPEPMGVSCDVSPIFFIFCLAGAFETAARLAALDTGVGTAKSEAGVDRVALLPLGPDSGALSANEAGVEAALKMLAAVGARLTVRAPAGVAD